MESSSKQLYLYQYLSAIEDAFKQNKTAKLEVIGSSMLPTLKPSDHVILTKPEGLKKGDIILYKTSETTLSLHRIVKISDVLIVGGDNNVPYEKVNTSSVIAKVLTICKQNGKQIKSGSFKFFCYYKLSLVIRLLRKVKRKIKNKLK